MTETPTHILTKRAVLEALPPHACIDNPFPFTWHAFWTTPAGLWDIRRDGHTDVIRILGPKLDLSLASPTADTVLATLWLHSALGEDPAFHADAEKLIAEVGKVLAKMPKVVVLCGSTRFYDAFQQANYDETMAGNIVLSVGFYPHSKAEHGHGEGVGHDSAEKVKLDELHLRKIDLADEVLVLNVGGYVGESTKREIDYAITQGKKLRWLEPGREDTPEEIAERARPFVACKAPDPINPNRFCRLHIGHTSITPCRYVYADELPASADDEGDETAAKQDPKWPFGRGLYRPVVDEPAEQDEEHPDDELGRASAALLAEEDRKARLLADAAGVKAAIERAQGGVIPSAGQIVITGQPDPVETYRVVSEQVAEAHRRHGHSAA